MTPPGDLIITHMPYDPLWQFLNYPVTRDDGYAGNFMINKKQPYFNYSDTLNKFINQSYIERLKSSYKRIKDNGVKDTATVHIIKNFRFRILFYEYSNALIYYKDGSNRMKNYYEYKDNKFIPKKSNAEIIKMLDDAENSLRQSDEHLNEIFNIFSKLNVPEKEVQTNNADLEMKIKKEREFLENYFQTGNFK